MEAIVYILASLLYDSVRPGLKARTIKEIPASLRRQQNGGYKKYYSSKPSPEDCDI